MYSGIEHETKSTKLSTRRIEIVEEYVHIYMTHIIYIYILYMYT